MWKRKLTIKFPKSSGVGQTSWERWVGEKTNECKQIVIGNPTQQYCERSVVGRWKRIMRGAYRRVSKDLSRAKMTYIMYILIIWSLYSLTNKVEEHCAFPSLLSLICGYLRICDVWWAHFTMCHRGGGSKSCLACSSMSCSLTLRA